MGESVNDNNIIKVHFLGEEYSFPGELAQYAVYCDEFEKVNDRLLNKLLITMKKKPMDGDCAYADMREKLEVYMQEEGKRFITKLSNAGVYDVTESDVIYSNKGYKYYLKVKNKMVEGSRKILLNAMTNWMDERDNIHAAAGSTIRGTGYGLISNSFLAHATFAAVEYSTLKQQAKRADRQFQQSMDELNRRTFSQEEKQYVQFYASEIYPEIANAFNMFATELMAIYLQRLQEKGLFDNNKIYDYSLNRSAEILKNLNIVNDKRSVLKEAFKLCPFNPDIYAAVISAGFFDVETLKAAKEFHQEKTLMSTIENKINSGLNNIEKVKGYIEVLAYYQGKTEIDILKKFYESTISKVIYDYREIFFTCIDSRRLSMWIKNHINMDRDKIISSSEESVRDKVNLWIKKTVDDKQYKNLSAMGLISIDDIKYKGSTKTTLEEVQTEYADKMITLIMDYIKELGEKKAAYKEAYDKYNAGLKKYTNAISEKNIELKQQGLFAFSKKKEIRAEIERLNGEYEEYRKTEPKDLENAYLNM